MSHIKRVSRFIFFLQAFALAAVVAGFPLAAAFSQTIEVSSTPFSIGIRGLSALACAMLLVISVPWTRGRIRWWLVATLVGFWILYLLRMTNDTTKASYTLMAEPSNYWLWAIGGSLVPLLGLARARFDAFDANGYFNWCFAFVISASFLVLPNMSTMVETDYGGYEGGRAALTALNPISLGHLGVQLVLLCTWGLFLRAGEKSRYMKLLFVIGGLLGAYLALAANSRGPLVSLVVALMLAAIASNLRSKYWLIGLMTLVAAAFVPIVALVDKVAGTQVYDRLLGQSQFDEVNTLSRLDLYASAWAQFAKFPLTGYGLEDPVFGGYPHNLVIEAFMATGIFGGLMMLAIIILTLTLAYRVMRDIPNFGWLALLVVQQVIAAQFSGSINQATILWGVLGALVSTSALGITAGSKLTPAPRTDESSPHAAGAQTADALG